MLGHMVNLCYLLADLLTVTFYILFMKVFISQISISDYIHQIHMKLNNMNSMNRRENQNRYEITNAISSFK